MKKYITILFASLMAFLASACLPLTRIVEDNELVVRVSINVAVGELAQSNPDAIPRVIEIAQAVKGYVGLEKEARVSVILAVVRHEIRWEKLTSVEAAIVEALLQGIGKELDQRLGEKPAQEDVLISVVKVLNWVEEAAVSYRPM